MSQGPTISPVHPSRKFMKAAASIGIAMGRSIAKPVMIFALAGLYLFIYDLRIYTFDMTKWWNWVLVFLGADFLSGRCRTCDPRL